MPEPTVLLTGFGPFGGHQDNPSWGAVEHVRTSGALADLGLVVEQLPVSFARATERVAQLVQDLRPAVTVSVGLAASRQMVSLERVGVNLADAAIPDVDGEQPVDVPAVPGAPPALFTTLPVKATVDRLRAAAVPTELSLSAGTYVCNAVMLAALDAALGVGRCGFVHVPRADVLPVPVAATAVATVVRTAMEVPVDPPRPEGRID